MPKTDDIWDLIVKLEEHILALPDEHALTLSDGSKITRLILITRLSGMISFLSRAVTENLSEDA